jgi:hypothetical protein
VSPDSPCCASRPPLADSAQLSGLSATAASWARINLHRSRRAFTEMRGLASTFSCSHASGFNIHSGMASCELSDNRTITTAALPRRRYRTSWTAAPYRG